MQINAKIKVHEQNIKNVHRDHLRQGSDWVGVKESMSCKFSAGLDVFIKNFGILLSVDFLRYLQIFNYRIKIFIVITDTTPKERCHTFLTQVLIL